MVGSTLLRQLMTYDGLVLLLGLVVTLVTALPTPAPERVPQILHGLGPRQTVW